MAQNPQTRKAADRLEEGGGTGRLTVKQMQQQLSEKITRMRKACNRLTDANARDAVEALSGAEDWYAKAVGYSHKQAICSFYERFSGFEKEFWETVEGGKS